jgi:multiple sugar transport system ATP-binding protein
MHSAMVQGEDMASVRLEEISKVYGGDNGHVAVEAATFEVEDGEFVVLVGPSGCGKSTTLRMIAGLESISAGRLYIGDRLVNNISPRDRDIAMVFQTYALYPHMSAYSNLAFALKLRSVSRDEIDRRVRRAAEILGIEEILNRTPRQLSGGQRQRVALGRAIVRDPQVFLFDEPLSNLDAKLRVQMRAELSTLHRRLGATMVYVTHDQVEAMTLGERIVVLKDGRIQQIDTPLELYDHPANRFVAGFVGSPAMNFIEGAVTGEEAILFRADEGAFEIQLPDVWSRALQPYRGRALTMGVRPEDLYVTGHGPSPAKLAEAWMRVEAVEPLGNEIFVHAVRGPQRVTARVAPQALPAPGEEISLGIDIQKLHFFDPEDEVAIHHVEETSATGRDAGL